MKLWCSIHRWWCNDDSKSLSRPFRSAITGSSIWQIQRQRSKHPKPIRPQLLMSQKLQMWSMWRMKAGEWEEMVMRSPEYDQNQTEWRHSKHSEQQWKENKQKERHKVKSKTKTREQQKQQHVNTQWKIKIWYNLKFHSKPFVGRCWGILVLIVSSCLG